MKLLRQWVMFLGLLLGASGLWASEPVSERAWVEDPTGRMTLAQAMAAPQTPLTGSYFGQGFSDSAFWIRLRIDPAQWPHASPDTELVIRLRPVYTDEFQLHDPLAPQGEVRYTGDRHPWANDDYQSLNNNFVVPLGQAPRDIWLRLQTTASTLNSIEVLDLKTARAKDMRQVAWGLMYLAVLLICAGWGMLSWFGSRDRLVRLYVFREIFMIVYAMVVLGVWRVLAADIMAPAWIDASSNLGFFTVVLVVIWFDIHFLREFKPHPRWVKLLHGFLAVFFGGLVLGLAGHVGWAMRLHAVTLTLCFVAVFLTALSTRVWSTPEGHPKPVVSKKVLVGFYLFVLLLGIFNRLVVMGLFPGAVDVWDMLLLYPLTGSVLMMVLLQLRAQQQHRLQQEAAWRIALAERSAQEEKAKRQEQQQFLAMLGHELRNPLSAVNFLADGRTREGQQIRRAVQDMHLVLERSVQAERLDEAGFQAQADTVHLPALLHELGRRAAPERLQLRTQALPEHIQTDQLLLSIVLGNLIDNALKYSPEASQVTLEAELLADAVPATVRFRVANAVGPAGVPQADQLFKKYYRNPAAQHQVGSGLGLYLVKGLLQLLGGTIAYLPAAAQPGPSVVFEVHLPVQWAPAA